MPTLTICPSCRAPITVDYVRLGAVMACPHCGQLTVPQVPVGGSIPATGYQLTYRDFLQLIESADGQTAVSPLLLTWDGISIEPAGADTIVRGADGALVDRLELHLQIQGDEEQQSRLYRTAMSLWR
jgi:hypothetical protein